MTRRQRFFTLEMSALLREFRLKAGLTQTEVARYMGLKRSSGHSFVSQLETGRIEHPFNVPSNPKNGVSPGAERRPRIDKT